MPGVPFEVVVEALGGCVTRRVDGPGAAWILYHVDYETPAGAKEARYLYLAHRCPWGEAAVVRESDHVRAKSYEVVVATRSDLAANLERVQRLFGGRAAMTTQGLLHEKILGRFIPQQLDDLATPYFTRPDATAPGGEKRQALELLAGALTEPSGGGQEPYATVLVAGGGLGKTTLCRVLASQMLRAPRRRGGVPRSTQVVPPGIPVLVESEQWRNLLTPNLTLDNVFTAALLHALPGAAALTTPTVFRTLVREGLLVPIFDGFDELCVHPNSAYSPGRLLQELLELVGDSGVRILITSRETFWEKHRLDFDESRIVKVKLQGFSPVQRREFFKKRLQTVAEQERANRIAAEISGTVYPGIGRDEEGELARPTGVPLVLELIAVSAEGEQSAHFRPDGTDPLGPLLESVCEREVVRQQIDIAPVTQMAIFEELFRDHPADIDREDLAMYVQVHAPHAGADAIARFSDHYLLSPGAPLKPRFDILTVYFVARWLARELDSVTETPGAARSVANVLARHAGGNTAVLDWVEERLSLLPAERLRDAIRQAMKLVRNTNFFEGACSAVFHLVQRLARRREDNREGRTRFILEHLGSVNGGARHFADLHVQGQIAGLDLGGITFDRCNFRDVEFRSCRFDDATRFRSSRFDGAFAIEGCEGAGQCRPGDDCPMSHRAERTWDLISRRRSRPEVRYALIREALRDVLRRFVASYGFVAVPLEDFEGAPPVQSGYGKVIWRELEATKIAGRGATGLTIDTDTLLRHEIRNFLDNAIVGARLHSLIALVDEKLTLNERPGR